MCTISSPESVSATSCCPMASGLARKLGSQPADAASCHSARAVTGTASACTSHLSRLWKRDPAGYIQAKSSRVDERDAVGSEVLSFLLPDLVVIPCLPSVTPSLPDANAGTLRGVNPRCGYGIAQTANPF